MSRKMIDYKVENGKIISIDGYELGGGSGGGGNNTVVTSVTRGFINKGQIRPAIHWSSTAGLALLPNTSYQVGDQVKISFDWSPSKITIGENQILVPVSCVQYVEDVNKKLTYGDVILVLTTPYAKLNITSDDNRNFYPFVENYATYTVVKAGTTGSDVSIPSTGWTDLITYFTYTLEVNKPAA